MHVFHEAYKYITANMKSHCTFQSRVFSCHKTSNGCKVAEGGHAPTRLPLVRKVTTNTFDQETGEWVDEGNQLLGGSS